MDQTVREIARKLADTYPYPWTQVEEVCSIVKQMRDTVGLPDSGLECDCGELLAQGQKSNVSPTDLASKLLESSLKSSSKPPLKSKDCGCGIIAKTRVGK